MPLRPRKNPSLAEKLDAALHALLAAQGRPIDRETAKSLKVGELAARFQFDHWPKRHADGGTTHPSNLQPLLKAEHGVKTAKKDMPEMAKARRLAAAQAEFRARVTAIKNGEPIPRAKKFKAKWPSRPMNGKGAKLRSRNTFQKARP